MIEKPCKLCDSKKDPVCRPILGNYQLICQDCQGYTDLYKTFKEIEDAWNLGALSARPVISIQEYKEKCWANGMLPDKNITGEA